MGFVNNKGAYQPAHRRSLVSAFFFIHLLESVISSLATSKISIFLLVSVDEEAGLNLVMRIYDYTLVVKRRPTCLILHAMHLLLLT